MHRISITGPLSPALTSLRRLIEDAGWELRPLESPDPHRGDCGSRANGPCAPELLEFALYQPSGDTSHTRQRALLEADRLGALGLLISGIMHEINNPNGCLRGGVDLLIAIQKDLALVLDEYCASRGSFSLGGLPYESIRTELPEILREMRAASERIARIVSDLREFSRQDAERPGEMADLNRAVETAVRLAKSEVGRRTDRFEVEYAEPAPSVRGNHQRLVQLTVNLLANACGSLSHRSDAVRVSTRHEPGQGVLMLEVEGLDARVFEATLAGDTVPFPLSGGAEGRFRASLEAASTIASGCGGTLRIEPTSDGGTRVIVTLCAAVTELETP